MNLTFLGYLTNNDKCFKERKVNQNGAMVIKWWKELTKIENFDTFPPWFRSSGTTLMEEIL
jgi:hypothetical protein